MQNKRIAAVFIGLVQGLLLAACSNDDGGEKKNSGECDLAAPQCDEGQACEQLADGTGRCFAPVLVRGLVLNALTEEPIEDALVQAMDANEAPMGAAVHTDAAGHYELAVPAARDEEGSPQQGGFTLRAAAQSYEPFPTPIRPALPLDIAAAAAEGDGWALESTATELRLLPVQGDTSELGSISGTVVGEQAGGVLVVAAGGDNAYSGMSDKAGAYTIFNVPAGAFVVSGYAAGAQLKSANTTLAAGEDKVGVDLEADAQASLSTVSGNVQIVNAPGGSVTSVVLALESTFAQSVARGVVPPGLRAAGVTSAFSISGVPKGRYVVLAAFENDGLVRDPDQTIGGTDIVHIEAPDPSTGTTITLSEGFKVTGALGVISPGKEQPEAVKTVTPDLVFAGDSSEDGYLIKVFDAYGVETWTRELLMSSGGEDMTIPYEGPTLEEGRYYQFRALSFREKQGQRTYISATEDLRGVFFYQP